MIPAIIPPTVVKTMKFMKKKVLKCIVVIKDAYIGQLIPYTLPLVIAEVIIVVMLVEVNIGHKRPDTLTLSII